MRRSDRWGPSTCRSTAGVTERAGRAALRGRLAASAATPLDSFASPKDLAELVAGWPAQRLVAIWNSLPGVTPVKPVQGPGDGGHPDLEEHPGSGPGRQTEGGATAAAESGTQG
jgi:hypothetical protein